MRIKVSFKELKSLGNFCNKEAGAEIEFEVSPKNLGELQKKFQKAYNIVREQVKCQLEATELPIFSDDREFDDLF